MRPRPRDVPTAIAGWALLALVSGCGFLDPLDQAGLHLEMSPRDTAVTLNAHLQARALMVNSYQDRYPSTHIRYRGLDAIAPVRSDGDVTGLAFGRARVVGLRGDLADTGWVSVVPTGTLAVSTLSDNSVVSVMETDGSRFQQLAPSGQVYGGAAAWLPGEAGLVFQWAVPGGAGSTHLFVTDLTGNSRELLPYGSYPRVTRDGAWIYFEKASGSGEIWRVHVDGTGLERIIAGGAGSPDPSPDGSGLVFWSAGLALTFRNLATGADTPLGVTGLRPRWSPNGTRIAYWWGPLGNTHPMATGAIFIVNADGTGARQVSADGRLYRSWGLDWSPDGQWLVARSDSSLDLIQVTTGLTLPLRYSSGFFSGSWKP